MVFFQLLVPDAFWFPLHCLRSDLLMADARYQLLWFEWLACYLELPTATDSELACRISLGLINVCLLGCFAFLVSLILSSNSICLGEHGCPLFSLLGGAGLQFKPRRALPSTEHDFNMPWADPCPAF